jgi:trehalose 6-phosphate phosphatase
MDPESTEPSNRSVGDPPRVLDDLLQLGERLAGAESVLLFLDFDGTLAPIVDDPTLAKLPAATRQTLNELAALENVTIAIVSGRALGDVKGRVGMPGLSYAGNHGLEIEGPGLSFEHPVAAGLRRKVRHITERVAAKAACLDGVEIELKGLSSSVHFRRSSVAARIELDLVIREIIADDDPDIAITAGKMVHEIRPRVGWDKGTAVVWIREHLGGDGDLPIVLGDDKTDESAFMAFEDAITICVDPRRPTAAKYQLDNPEEVREFLEWVRRVWEKRLGATKHRTA